MVDSLSETLQTHKFLARNSRRGRVGGQKSLKSRIRTRHLTARNGLQLIFPPHKYNLGAGEGINVGQPLHEFLRAFVRNRDAVSPDSPPGGAARLGGHELVYQIGFTTLFRSQGR